MMRLLVIAGLLLTILGLIMLNQSQDPEKSPVLHDKVKPKTFSHNDTVQAQAEEILSNSNSEGANPTIVSNPEPVLIDFRNDKNRKEQLTLIKYAVVHEHKDMTQWLDLRADMDHGQLNGMIVDYGIEKKWLYWLGFQPGDRIIEVNHMPLNDLGTAEQILMELVQQQEIQLSVQRKGKQIQILFALNNLPADLSSAQQQ
ncbi:PDZ domain-containing protein [Algicola sagamiensis]|uniref:PDZ domain-containing protein n=1 Tax=Algicola sagamiensis TaxID=163869 RepID=UPI00035DDC29|nr:hypothetical protein [Algicola sagamiensis]